MPLTHLELLPGFGDQTVGGAHFVLRGNTVANSEEMARQGLRFIPGEASVSSDLSYEADKWSNEAARLNVLTVPTEFHVGYPVQDTAFVIRADKLVIGAPLRYARARAELSLYIDLDTEAEAAKLESEIVNGSPLSDRPAFTVDARNILGWFSISPQLTSVLKRLSVSIESFEAFDRSGIEAALIELFECREPAQAVLVPTMVHELVVRAAESLVIAKMRMMRWQGLAALGYKFKEGSEDAGISAPSSTDEQRRRMEESRKSAETSAIFTGELAWLKTYVLRELELMRIELDGAELEGA